MGHLINPIIYRLGKSRMWDSSWGFFTNDSYKISYIDDFRLLYYIRWFFYFFWFNVCAGKLSFFYLKKTKDIELLILKFFLNYFVFFWKIKLLHIYQYFKSLTFYPKKFPFNFFELLKVCLKFSAYTHFYEIRFLNYAIGDFKFAKLRKIVWFFFRHSNAFYIFKKAFSKKVFRKQMFGTRNSQLNKIYLLKLKKIIFRLLLRLKSLGFSNNFVKLYRKLKLRFYELGFIQFFIIRVVFPFLLFLQRIFNIYDFLYEKKAIETVLSMRNVDSFAFVNSASLSAHTPLPLQISILRNYGHILLSVAIQHGFGVHPQIKKMISIAAKRSSIYPHFSEKASRRSWLYLRLYKHLLFLFAHIRKFSNKNLEKNFKKLQLTDRFFLKVKGVRYFKAFTTKVVYRNKRRSLQRSFGWLKRPTYRYITSERFSNMLFYFLKSSRQGFFEGLKEKLTKCHFRGKQLNCEIRDLPRDKEDFYKKSFRRLKCLKNTIQKNLLSNLFRNDLVVYPIAKTLVKYKAKRKRFALYDTGPRLFVKFICLFFFFIFRIFYWTRISLLLSKKLSAIISSNVFVVFFSMPPQCISARLVSSHIAAKLKLKYKLGSVIYPVINYLKKLAFLKGFKIMCCGRFTRKQRATFLVRTKGSLGYGSISSLLDYNLSVVFLRFGACGIKVWLSFKRANFDSENANAILGSMISKLSRTRFFFSNIIQYFCKSISYTFVAKFDIYKDKLLSLYKKQREFLNKIKKNAFVFKKYISKYLKTFKISYFLKMIYIPHNWILCSEKGKKYI